MTATARPKAWIVEDSKLEAEMMCRALAANFECVVFSDCAPMLSRLAHGETPLVLLLDWELPDMSGLEACRFIRLSHDRVRLPVLLVTIHRDTSDIVSALEAGANDFIAKPFVPAELLARTKGLAVIRELHTKQLQSEASLATTLRSIGDAVISTDPDGQVRFMNPPAERLTGWTHMEALDRPLSDVLRLVHETTGAVVDPLSRGALSTRDVVELPRHTLLVRRDGSELPIADSTAPITDEQGALTGAVITFRDVSQMRQAEAEREAVLARAMTAQAEAQDRALFERLLIGIVSHDLRNPLSTISLATHLLMSREDLDPQVRKLVTRVQSAATRGARMVGDLLDFTQARLGGGIPLNRAPGDLHVVVRQAVDDSVSTAPERDVHVSTAGDASGSWDLERFAQVVLNLVSNAFKYSPTTSVVDVNSKADADGVTVTVHNDGEPIPSEALARIFEPLQRATTQLHNAARSIGLGLYIVRHLVEAHGGHVSVVSTPEAGTTFSVWVPKRAAD